MSGGGISPAAGARRGRARPALPARDTKIPPDWAELLDRLDRLERARAEAAAINSKGEGQ